MVTHILTRFLESSERYEEARAFWGNVLDGVARKIGAPSVWEAWESERFLDGNPLPRDGNPIFSSRCAELGRAVRIIQSPPESDSMEIAAWVDSFDFSADGGPPFTEELVINLAASKEVVDTVRDLLELWMDRSISRERMADIASELEAK
jgi:hypothetical protein